MDRVLIEDVDSILSAGKNQTGAALLASVASDFDRLKAILRTCVTGPLSDADVESIRLKVVRLREKARWAKVANGTLFVISVLAFMLATLWPGVALIWKPLEGDLLNGMTQSGVFLLAGLLLAAYRTRKLRQAGIEDGIRCTLARKESAGAKGDRLEVLLRPVLNRGWKKREKKESEPRPWWIGSAEGLAASLEGTLGRAPEPGEILALGTELKEAGIKAYSYRWLTATMGALAGLSVLGGLSLPVLVHVLGTEVGSSVVGMGQSLLILGLGSFFWGVRKQYAQRRKEVLAAMQSVLGRAELFHDKAMRIPEALRKIDTGWFREEGDR